MKRLCLNLAVFLAFTYPASAQMARPLPTTVVDATGKFIGYLGANLETVIINANGLPLVIPVGPGGFTTVPFQGFGFFYGNANCTGQSYMALNDTLAGSASNFGYPRFSYYSQYIICKNITQTTQSANGIVFIPDWSKTIAGPAQYYGNLSSDGSGVTACVPAVNMSNANQPLVPVAAFNVSFKTPFRMR